MVPSRVTLAFSVSRQNHHEVFSFELDSPLKLMHFLSIQYPLQQCDCCLLQIRNMYSINKSIIILIYLSLIDMFSETE